MGCVTTGALAMMMDVIVEPVTLPTTGSLEMIERQRTFRKKLRVDRA
jgi:hypothetical protein